MSLTVNNVASYQPSKSQNIAFGKTICIIKPELYEIRNRIISKMIEKAGYKVTNRFDGFVPENVVRQHYSVHKGKPFYKKLIERMSKNRICVLELDGGKGDVERFREFTLKKLRPRFINPDEKTLTGFHAADSVESAEKEIEIWKPFFLKQQNIKGNKKKINTKA